MSVRVGLPTTERLPAYRRLVMAVTILGTYLVAINATVLGLALPAIAQDLGIRGTDADWIITAYLLALASALPATGYLATRFGKRRTYLACLAVFAVGALLSALAGELALMLVGRVAQGLGGGAILPLSMTMVYELAPPERRSTAIGTWGIALAAAPALGPPAGGWVLTAGSWRWIFVALLVIALMSLTLGAFRLRELDVPRRLPLDIGGWLAVVAVMVCVVVGSRYAAAWGATSPWPWALAAAAALAGLVLARGLRRREAPILDLRVFRGRAFACASALIALVTIAQFAKLNYLPIELQVVRGLSAFHVGLLLAPAGLAVSLAMPLGGRLADRLGPRTPVAAGLAITVASMVGMGRLEVDTGMAVLVAIVLGHGMGAGLMFSPLQVATMKAVPQTQIAQAAAITQLNRQLSAALGVAALAAILVARVGSVSPTVVSASARLDAQMAYNELFLVTAVLVAVGAVLVRGLPGRAQVVDAQRDRRTRSPAQVAEATTQS